ncbi:MAG: RNA polymerase sigma factor [Bacteroidales bacterium]|nr:RNA polymerase sigma factor [Bacteroidales bacterium]
MKKEKCFKDYINKHGGIIGKVVMLYTNDEEDRKDLRQEILYQCWKSFDSYKGEAAFSTWLYRLSLNTALVFKRKERQHVSIEEQQPQEQQTIQQPDTDLLLYIIKKLNEIDRMIISLHLDGYSNEEIASFIGQSKTYVAVKLHRIKKDVTNQFKKLEK